MRNFALSFVSLLVIGGLVSGCSTDTKRALGLNKQVPDEYSIITNTPLVVPPEFDLVSPVDATLNRSESQTEEKAKTVLMGKETVKTPTVEKETPLYTGFSDLGLSDVSVDSPIINDIHNVKKVEVLNNQLDTKGDDVLLGQIKYDKDIRKKVNDDYESTLAENDTFVKNLLFWQKDEVEKKDVIDAGSEKSRIDKIKAEGGKIDGGDNKK